eukprot:TRINITY_DN6298_c0_g1_i4.p1 TRINITY_DN6298_c0_g1~~TRINITY_DN6298_c0_g1_i4.p1  ORF type:complete len:722 (+),score=96.60 TRINITY_DN6298_c0_g1_i4:204-2369(+)
MPPLEFQDRLQKLESRVSTLADTSSAERCVASDIADRLTALEEAFVDRMDLADRLTVLEAKFHQHEAAVSLGMARCDEPMHKDQKFPLEAPGAKTDIAQEHASSASILASEAVAQGSSKRQDDDDHRIVEYVVSESVWDAVIILHDPRIGWGASVMLIFAIILNGVLQLYLCLVLFSTPGFVDISSELPFAAMVSEMRTWRLTEGHKLDNLRLDGVNLVSRVCGGDGSLSNSRAQSSILEEINVYLNLEPSEFESSFLRSNGPPLATLCIFFHCMTMLGELRDISQLAFAVLALPRAHRTEFSEDRAILAISVSNLACTLTVLFLRVIIALALLLVGTEWLAGTSAITDLILNTVALSFVLELDSLLFNAIVPKGVQKAVAEVAPLKFKRPRWNLDALIPLVGGLVFVWVSFYFLIQPNVEDMLNVKFELCGGLKEFVAEKSPIGIMQGVATRPFDESGSADVYEVRAVHEVVIRNNRSRNSVFALMQWHGTDQHAFSATRGTSRKENAEAGILCVDYDVASWFPWMLEHQPFVFNTANAIVDPTGTMGFSEEFRCNEYKAACDGKDNFLIRLLCPVTCGCNKGMSGLLFARISDYGGCPQSCVQEALDDIRNASCTDLPVTSSSAENAAVRRSWNRFWNSFVNSISPMFPSFAEEFEAVAARMISNGCNDTEQMPVSELSFCDPMWFGESTWPITRFCPRTCCHGVRSATRQEICPVACL